MNEITLSHDEVIKMLEGICQGQNSFSITKHRVTKYQSYTYTVGICPPNSHMTWGKGKTLSEAMINFLEKYNRKANEK